MNCTPLTESKECNLKGDKLTYQCDKTCANRAVYDPLGMNPDAPVKPHEPKAAGGGGPNALSKVTFEVGAL